MDHLLCGVCILNLGRTGNHIQCIEQKVGIYLVFQHLQPHLVQLLLHPVLFRQGFNISPGTGFHGAKGPDQAGNLITALCTGVRAREIIFPYPSGVLRQLYHGADNVFLDGTVQPSDHQKGCRSPQNTDCRHNNEQRALHLIPLIARLHGHLFQTARMGCQISLNPVNGIEAVQIVRRPFLHLQKRIPGSGVILIHI